MHNFNQMNWNLIYVKEQFEGLLATSMMQDKYHIYDEYEYR